MPVAFLLGPLNHLMPNAEIDQQPSKLLDNTQYLDLKELQDFILIWLPRHIIQIDKGLAQVLSHQR